MLPLPRSSTATSTPPQSSTADVGSTTDEAPRTSVHRYWQNLVEGRRGVAVVLDVTAVGVVRRKGHGEVLMDHGWCEWVVVVVVVVVEDVGGTVVVVVVVVVVAASAAVG